MNLSLPFNLTQMVEEKLKANRERAKLFIKPSFEK